MNTDHAKRMLAHLGKSEAHTPGPWLVATSNSWRRIVNWRHEPVCEPITQRGGHPDLHFRNGGENGPDARLIAAAPEMLRALQSIATGLAPGNRTFDELMRDAMLSCDIARSAINKATGAAP